MKYIIIKTKTDCIRFPKYVNNSIISNICPKFKRI